jgi:hypothetical protein
MERKLAKPVLISKLDFPSVIDVSNGTVPSVFSVELVPGALGAGVKVQMSFDYIPFDFRLGDTGKINDTFTDSTPNYGSSTYEFWRGYPAGEYTISTLYVWDDVGHAQNYSAADLAALGLPNHFTVIDKLAPVTPTENLTLKGNVAQLNGTAGAGDSIKVTYKDEKGTTHTLGTTTADANGVWKLASEPLADGEYSQMVAIATNSGGYASTYSQPLSFIVRGVPDAPSMYVSGNYAMVTSKLPLVWGMSVPDSTVQLYDNGRLFDTVTADEHGWWGSLLKTSSGQHAMTSVVTDTKGMISAASVAMDLWVMPAADSISFEMGSFKNDTAQAFDRNKLTAALGAVSALFDVVLSGSQKIQLAVTISDTPANETGYASTSSVVKLPTEHGAMPVVTQAQLTISSAFAKMINDAPSLTADSVALLAHEMLHVLGITESGLSAFSKIIDGKTYFMGANSVLLNGGPVLLSADKGHVSELGHLATPDNGEGPNFFLGSVNTVPFTDLDLVILKDLGYQNLQTLISRDGHKFILGTDYGVFGQDGTIPDTLYVDGKAADYQVDFIDTDYFGYALSYKNEARAMLGSLERIHFDDGMVALDVFKGQTGGQVYRMYQAAFDRKPDSAGLGYWISQMDKGESLLGMASQFKNSAEFINLYGNNLNDSAYVNQLYHNVLHRTADKAGLDYWLGAINAGATRESVLVEFSESNENVAQLTGTLANGFSYVPWVG